MSRLPTVLAVLLLAVVASTAEAGPIVAGNGVALNVDPLTALITSRLQNTEFISGAGDAGGAILASLNETGSKNESASRTASLYSDLLQGVLEGSALGGYSPVDLGIINVADVSKDLKKPKDPKDPKDQPQPVPEPATLLLVGSGVALAYYRQRRSRPGLPTRAR